MFDIENTVEDIKYVREAEVVSAEIEGNNVPIVHLILEKKAKKISDEVIKMINEVIKKSFDNPNAIPYAYKIRESFDTSPISGKRDYVNLAYETEGFLKLDDNNNLYPINLQYSSSKDKSLLKSKILIKK